MHEDSPAHGVWVVVVAGGSGRRYGAAKQFLDLAGRTVVDRSIETARRHAEGVVVVVPADREPGVWTAPEDVVVVPGGATRSDSVRAGLAVVPDAAEVVLVHDGARPLADDGVYERVVAAVRGGAEAAIPVVEVADSLRSSATGAVDRAELAAVQTPQGFTAAALRAAHAGQPDATDDATLVERSGGTVVLVDGDPRNRKITTPEDLRMATALLDETAAGPAIRVGHAYDVHAHSDDPDRVLVLGGVAFPDAAGLAGHSDADVVAHVCIDALLGAAGLGDIGQMFPDTDPDFAGADSVALLAEASRRVRAEGWRPANVDCSVVLDRPKLAPVKAQMEATLSEAVGAPVTVSGRRSEGLGAIGRGEGIAAWAVALVQR